MDKKAFAQFLLLSAVVLIVWWGANYLLLGGRRAPRPLVGKPIERIPSDAVPEQAAQAQITPKAQRLAPTPPPPQQQEGSKLVEGLVLEGKHLRTVWTNRGAALQKLQILDEHYRAPYRVNGKRPRLTLLDQFQEDFPSDVIETVTISSREGGEKRRIDIPMHDFRYDVEQTAQSLQFRAVVEDGLGHQLMVRKNVRITDEYHYEVSLEFENASARPFEFSYALRGAAGIEREMLKTVYLGTRVAVRRGPDDYKIAKRSAAKLGASDSKPNKSASIAWAGVVNHYFAAITLLDDAEWVGQVQSLGVIERDVVQASGRWDSDIVRHAKNRRALARNATVVIHALPVTLASGEKVSRQYRFVAAPKEAQILKPYDAKLGALVELGLFPGLGRFILTLLNLLYALIPNYGVAIILLTVMVRVILHPLTRKSQMSMARMQKLQPHIQELQKQFGNDKEKMAQAQMELWRKYGASPISGCGPMLLQVPVMIALFMALRAAIALRHAPFLWILDLSQPDALFRLPFFIPLLRSNEFNLLPILMAASWILNSSFTSAPGGADQARQQQKMMKWMPILFLFMLYRFPSGLCLYLTFSSSIGVLERWAIQRKSDQIELEPVAEKRKRKARRNNRPDKKKKIGLLDRLQKFADDQDRKADKKKRGKAKPD